MTTILFYFLIVLALAGSSYYGWKSAKSAKNRQETQEQKRLRVRRQYRAERCN